MIQPLLRIGALLTTLAGCVSAAVAPAAEPLLYTVAPGAGRATFRAHATGHDFNGTTIDLRGHVRFLHADLQGARGEIRIMASTIDTGNAKRNEDMWGLLEIRKHPDITFELAGARGEAKAGGLPPKLELQGEIAVRGARKPLVVQVETESGEGWIVIRGAFPLDIRDFGIEPPRALLFIKMDPVVNVDFESRFQKVD